MHHRARLLLSLPLLISAVSSCGDDEEPAADSTAFCNAYMTMQQASDADVKLTSLASRVDVLVDDVEASAPQELSKPLGVVIAATRRAAAEATPKAFMSRKVSDAQAEVVSYMFDNCKFKKRLHVTGVEHTFEGVPDAVPAGLVALRFANRGEEPHEFILFRKRDGVTESFEEILELPEADRRSRMTFVTALSVVEPGESREAVFQAEPGEYIALCLLPMGSPVAEPSQESGPPEKGPEDDEEDGGEPQHWREGMRSEFTVA